MPGPAFSADLPGAVVLDAFATGLNTARALSAHGVRVAVVAMGDHDIAQYSRAVSQTYHLPAPRSPEALLDLLTREAPPLRGYVLIPASDLAVETLARFGERLRAAQYRFAVPEWRVTRRLLRKDLMRQDAERCGVDTPRCHGLLSRAIAARSDLGYPVLVRPLRSAASSAAGLPKALTVAGPDGLAAAAGRFAEAGISAEVLELIGGGDDRSFNYTGFMAPGGRLVAGCALHKLRKSPPLTGIARVAETVHDPEVEAALRDPLVRLLGQVGWHGPFSAEFKRHPETGRFVLIEINGRMAFMFRLAWARGLDFAWMQYCQALGKACQETAPTAWSGVLIHLHADLMNTLFRRRQERLGWRDYLEPYRRPRIFAVWEARDPLPFVVEWSRSAARAPRRLAQRWRRSASWPGGLPGERPNRLGQP